jgi:endonuclease/exonuclease/phosphatase family metal-dependent hydrolase
MAAIAVLFSLPFFSGGQDSCPIFRVMLYNVENYFDPFDDPLTRDEEFTPSGARSWTYGDFMEKSVKIARVIMAAGNPEPPAIVGLTEIENRFVLEKLVYETPLKRFGYRIIHEDSRDPRGIDAALIYRKDFFKIDTFYYRKVHFKDTAARTRDILVVRGSPSGGDTLALIVNHWPSRYGGAAGSSYKRMAAAFAMREIITELYEKNPCENIVAMGDFNDEPDDPSMKAITAPYDPARETCMAKMVNLMPVAGLFPLTGTIKHEGHWYFFDQIIVSKSLLEGSNRLEVYQRKAAVLSAAFLLETDNSHLGVKPFRSFVGPANHHGFSDHLPVIIDIKSN